MKPINERLISKTAGLTDARKKVLTTTFQVCHLLPQSLNPCINGVNSRLNSPHEKGSGNLMEVVHNELYSKAHTNKLLNCSSPLQDPLDGDSINEVMLNIIHHTPQHLQEVLSSKTAKVESLHEITTATVDRHQIRSAILKNFETMEVYIRRPRTPEICKIEVINLRLIKVCKEGCSLTHKVWNGGRTATHLKLRRGSGKWTYQECIKHDIRSRDLRRINSQGRNEEGDKGKRNSPGPMGMGVVGRAETGTEGTAKNKYYVSGRRSSCWHPYVYCNSWLS